MFALYCYQVLQLLQFYCAVDFGQGQCFPVPAFFWHCDSLVHHKHSTNRQILIFWGAITTFSVVSTRRTCVQKIKSWEGERRGCSPHLSEKFTCVSGHVFALPTTVTLGNQWLRFPHSWKGRVPVKRPSTPSGLSLPHTHSLLFATLLLLWFVNSASTAFL